MFFTAGGIPASMFGNMFDEHDDPDDPDAGPEKGKGGKGGGGFKGKSKGWPFGGKGFFGDGDDEEQDAEVNNTRFYELLGVSKDASDAEIKKAHKMAAIKHHPDKGGDPEMFKDIQKAFEVLRDPEKRQIYDQRGEKGLEDNGPGGPQDIFEHIFGGGKGGGRRGAGRQRTKDIVRPMWVTLEQLYTGVTRPLPITRKVIDDSGAGPSKCQACNGKGIVVQVVRMGPLVQQMQGPCPQCGGTGSSAAMKRAPEVLEVFVEKGSPDGHKITVHGKADEAPGCEPGDVIVVVKQQEHPRFMRKGADLYMEQEITLVEALTGFRITVTHLDGRKLIIRSQPGEVVQPQQGSGVAMKAVVDGGMPIHQDPFKFGNLFLIFSIRFPVSLDPPVGAELRRLFGAPPLPDDDEAGNERHVSRTRSKESFGDEVVEECFVQDVDPLESSRQAKAGGEAYDEDADGPGAIGCKQQ